MHLYTRYGFKKVKYIFWYLLQHLFSYSKKWGICFMI